MMTLPKDGESTGNNEGVWESFSSPRLASRLILYLVFAASAKVDGCTVSLSDEVTDSERDRSAIWQAGPSSMIVPQLPSQCSPSELDIIFVIDVTGSMADALKAAHD
jgi:hypothetical protein